MRKIRVFPAAHRRLSLDFSFLRAGVQGLGVRDPAFSDPQGLKFDEPSRLFRSQLDVNRSLRTESQGFEKMSGT